MKKKYNDFNHLSMRQHFLSLRWQVAITQSHIEQVKEYRVFAYRYLRAHNVQIIKRGAIRITPKSKLTDRVLTVICSLIPIPHPYAIRRIIVDISNRGDYQITKIHNMLDHLIGDYLPTHHK